MDLDDSETKERLRKLGTSRLVDALCTLAKRNEQAADYIARLVSTPEESADRIRSQLDELANGGYYVGYNEAYGFAGQLEDVIEDIRMNITSPEEGIEALSAFFEMDQPILEQCDDSNGAVAEVFRWDAGEAFVQFAKGCKDKDSILERVLGLYLACDYGVRTVLIERASEFLSKNKLRHLVQRLWECLEDTPDDDHRSRHALIGIELLAYQMKDPALFEKARMHGRPKPSAACCLDIAEAYADCHEDDKALTWLEQIPEEDHWRRSEQDDLLFAVLKRKGDMKRAEEVAWRIFRRHRTKNTFDQLVDVAGKRRRKAILLSQVEEILKNGRFSITDAMFLSDMNLNSEAAAYLVQNATRLDGNDYWSLTPLAERMEKQKQLLAAAAIYRSLLDSILARAQSKAYQHGAKYLRKLDAMDGRLSSWEPLASHDEYKTTLVRDHRRKWRFWEEYGERPE